jgi:tetrapyrrole methylase family protein/MazG family protein
VAGLPPKIRVRTFDHLYESAESYEQVYEAIITKVLELGHRAQGVVYAVPGHPFVAEATGPELVRRARAEGLALRLIPGISFLEPVFSALGIDPLPQMALVDALSLATRHVPGFPPDVPALVAQLDTRQIAGEVKLTLMSIYPDEHPVQLVHSAGLPEEKVESLPLYAIDRSSQIGNLSVLYVPPLGEATSFEAFQELIARLRAPDGCPWDRKQTHQSLRPNLLEEAYEVLSALDTGDPKAMCEEFGDLLLQVVLHAQIASEMGEFTMADILQHVHTKIVHRHPHVFGDLQVSDVEGVMHNWERWKEEERLENGEEEKGILDGVAPALPALAQAEACQKRAARVGFDWPDIQGVWDKVLEEMDELRTAADETARAQEFGDLLFALVNLARWMKVDPESALRQANARFRRRFGHIETTAHHQGRSLAEMTLDEMDALWNEAKAE